MKTDANDSIVSSSLRMTFIRNELAYGPALNSLIGGAIGGYRAGSVRRGVAASLLPALVAGSLVCALLASKKAPAMGILAGVAVGWCAMSSNRTLLIGAAVGGAAANMLTVRRRQAASFRRVSSPPTLKRVVGYSSPKPSSHKTH